MSLTLKNLKFKADSPDSDGDRWVQTKAKLSLDGAHGGTLLRMNLLVANADGLPLVIEDERREEPLDPGDSEKVEVTAMARVSLKGSSAQLRAELLDAHSVDLGTHEIQGVGSAVGGGSPITLSQGVVLSCWSVVVGNKDSDGDARLTMLAVVENAGKQAVAEVSVQMHLLKPKGGELESCDDELKGLLPGQIASIEASTYTKAKWFKKGVRVRCSATVRWVVASGVSEWAPLKK